MSGECDQCGEHALECRCFPNALETLYKPKSKRIKSGGHYCEVCKKCISPPRARKNFMEDWWTVCEECEKDVVRITFVPRENSIKTDFKVKHSDIPNLASILMNAYHNFHMYK